MVTKFALMLKYTSQNQLEIFDFKTEFESKLDPNNRWVKMAKLLDWDKFAVIYGRKFSGTMGAKGIDARVVIGALIIKHLERKDDRGTIQMISENPYMQFFLGFDRFSSEPIFDPSLFVLIRKRLGDSDFDEMNKVYDAWVDPAGLPTRLCVQAGMDDVKVEIRAEAYYDED